MREAMLSAVSRSPAVAEGMTGWPSFCRVSRKSSLSSAFSMAEMSEPSSRAPYFSSVPSRESCIAMVSPVCPPSPASTPSGRSFSMMRRTVCAVSGSRYISSARSLSVMMVAGLELTSTVFIPSCRSTRQA